MLVGEEPVIYEPLLIERMQILDEVHLWLVYMQQLLNFNNKRTGRILESLLFFFFFQVWFMKFKTYKMNFNSRPIHITIPGIIAHIKEPRAQTEGNTYNQYNNHLNKPYDHKYESVDNLWKGE